MIGISDESYRVLAGHGLAECEWGGPNDMVGIIEIAIGGEVDENFYINDMFAVGQITDILERHWSQVYGDDIEVNFVDIETASTR